MWMHSRVSGTQAKGKHYDAPGVTLQKPQRDPKFTSKLCIW